MITIKLNASLEFGEQVNPIKVDQDYIQVQYEAEMARRKRWPDDQALHGRESSTAVCHAQMLGKYLTSSSRLSQSGEGSVPCVAGSFSCVEGAMTSMSSSASIQSTKAILKTKKVVRCRSY